mgnify:CR=1 FL=1
MSLVGRTFRSSAIAMLLLIVSPVMADDVVYVESGDEGMEAAMDHARSLLPHFWKTYSTRTRGEEGFSLKVRVEDDGAVEYFWATDVVRDGDTISGTINNEPAVVSSVSLGQRIQFGEADISDWLYIRENKMVGNYTLRAMFSQMSDEEVAYYSQILTDP